MGDFVHIIRSGPGMYKHNNRVSEIKRQGLVISEEFLDRIFRGILPIVSNS